jgi:ammonium transporter Rh
LSLGYKVFKVADIGGSMVIHVFGAYFGVVCCFFLRERPWGKYPAHTSTYTGDSFAFIGTFILWLLWPSFNAALAPPSTQYRVLINTVLSLCGATLVTFSLSNVFRHGNKLTAEDLQNATLAGGVAVGSAADLILNPGASLLLGCIAGAVSTIGSFT